MFHVDGIDWDVAFPVVGHVFIPTEIKGVVTRQTAAQLTGVAS
jgi:hypothetical protein